VTFNVTVKKTVDYIAALSMLVLHCTHTHEFNVMMMMVEISITEKPHRPPTTHDPS